MASSTRPGPSVAPAPDAGARGSHGLQGDMAVRDMHIGFVLLREYSMIAFANAIECFRMANYLARRTLYTWSVVTPYDTMARASNGLLLAPTAADEDLDECDLLFVCGGTNVRAATEERTRSLLRHCAAREIPLGGLCTGSFALASAGVMDGYRCAIHWENLAAIREEFAQVRFASEVFIIDRDRYTCSGGTAPIDLMLHLIRGRHGARLANAVSQQFVIDRQRAESDRQRMPQPECVGPGYERLAEAVEIMAANLEEALPVAEVAAAIQLSLRHLERLFHRYHGMSPAQYYINLRLRRAQELLMHSSLPVMQVTIACGFQSSSHFCKAYRTLFGYPPSDERRRRMPHAGAAASTSAPKTLAAIA